MKLLLTGIVLLYTSQYAFADSTLEFKDLISQDNSHKLTFNIKKDLLKFQESGSDRLNLFNQADTQFTSQELKTGKKSVINTQILQKRVNQLTAKRLNKLSKVEKQVENKLKDMSDTEQEVGETVLTQLKYPEMYGEQNLLIIKPIDKNKEIASVSCQVHQLFKKNKLVKEYCLASAKGLKMSPQNYKTLRSFYEFDYHMQSQIMLAMGKSNFNLVDFNKQKIPGVVVETIGYKDNKVSQHLILTSFSNQALGDDIFALKKDTHK